MNANKEKREFALLLTPNSVKGSNPRLGLSDFGTMDLYFVEIKRTGNSTFECVRGISDHPLADLHLSCQWDANKPTEPTYGWTVSYHDVFRVELRDAERMAKMLKRISRAEDKFPVRPATFGQFVSLTAQALGVKLLKKQKPSDLNRGSYDDYDYSDWTTKQGHWLIDDAIAEARKIPEVASA